MATGPAAVPALDPAWVARVEEVQAQAQRILRHLDATEQPAFWIYRADLLDSVAAVMRMLADASLRINAHLQTVDWNSNPQASLPVAADVAERMALLRTTVEQINRRLVNIRKIVSEAPRPGTTVT